MMKDFKVITILIKSIKTNFMMFLNANEILRPPYVQFIPNLV